MYFIVYRLSFIVYRLSFIVYRLSFIVYRLSFIAIVIGISSCGGGGDNSSSNSRIAALQVSSSNDEVLTIDDNNRAVTYTIAINNFPIGSTGYSVFVVKNNPNTEINITNNCTGKLATGSCTFDITYIPSNDNMRGNGPRGYTITNNNITITATPVSGGTALKKTITLQTSNDPLNTAINKYIGDYSADADTRGVSGLLNVNFQPIDWIYSTNKISNLKAGSWTSSNGASYAYPFNVPLIQTYSPTIGIFSPALAMKTRCGNTLVYLVVQSKLENQLTPNLPRAPIDPTLPETQQAGRENVTVKYHPLIADGITLGVDNGTHRKVIAGNLKILDHNSTQEYNNRIGVDAHANIWSGSDDIPFLRDLITTHISPENSMAISILENPTTVAGYAGGDPFFDAYNYGVTKVITVHSLLTPNAYDELREQYLQYHHNLGDIAKLADNNLPGLSANLTANNTFKNSLKAYRQQVALACAI